MRDILKLVDDQGQAIKGEQRIELLPLLRGIGIPAHVRTIHIDIHGYNPEDHSAQVTAKPARRGIGAIVENLEVHWPF